MKILIPTARKMQHDFPLSSIKYKLALMEILLEESLLPSFLLLGIAYKIITMFLLSLVPILIRFYGRHCIFQLQSVPIKCNVLSLPCARLPYPSIENVRLFTVEAQP